MERDDQGMSYNFRFLNIAGDVAELLTLKFATLGAKSTDHFEGDVKCVVVPITHSGQARRLREAMETHAVSPGHVDVFASLLTEMDTGIIGAPEFVLDVVRETGAGLTFSYTYVG